MKRFRTEGAHNVAFVWSPFTPADLAAWPGDEWVDWIGLDLFNYGTAVQNGGWTPFSTLLKWHLDAARSAKPILLAEVGCSGIGGDRAAWWRDAFHGLERSLYPEVGAVILFDDPAQHLPNGTVVDWGLFRTPKAIAASKPKALTAGFEHAP
ncbi:MAG: glycosyl hydrolase [Polyangiaceae bacterium]